jgi:hypothetical protein
MRRVLAALFSAIVAGLMLAMPASAATVTSIVKDPAGDVGFGVDPKTGGVMHLWGDNNPVSQAGFLDMVSTWMSQKGKTYTFGMELASAFPEEGTPLPNGFKVVEWALWIDPSPYNYLINPVAPLFLIALRYDGASYSAFVMDCSTMLSAPAAFSVAGSTMQLQFTADSIGNLAIEWWSPLIREWTGPVGTSGYWFVDGVNLPLVDGYSYIDLPWPPA